MNWRQRLGAFIGGFDAGQQHRRLRGFQATRAHVNALISASGQDITALVIQQPNFFGNLEDVDAQIGRAHV